ncbi:MAG: DUF2993 domain-containing protein [Oscillatoriaceae cyanobacterium]
MFSGSLGRTSQKESWWVRNPVSSPDQNWGESLLNAVATAGIRHLFSKCEALEVAIALPSPLGSQGRIDGLRVSGRGLEIQRRFPVGEMSFNTDAVAIDYMALLGGKIKLAQPTQAVAQVVLTEEGINRAFQADLVTKKLSSANIPVTFSEVEVQLKPQNQLRIFAKAKWSNGETVPVCLHTTISIEQRRRLQFSHPHFEAEVIPEPLRERAQTASMALVEVLNQMVDLDKFNLDGITMRLNRLETQGKQLLFSGYAQINHFPGQG